MRHLGALALLGLAACPGPGAPPAPVGNGSIALVTSGPWQIEGEVVGLAPGRVFVWDREWQGGTGGLAERSTADGALIRTRVVGGQSNGGLRFWEPVPGGYLAHWDGPAFVAERGETLAVAWSAPGDDWFDYHVVLGGSLILSASRDAAAVVRLSIADGHEEWRAPLVRWSQDITIATDGEAIYATWQEYDPNAPTPTVVMARRVRALDPATGATRWTRDFVEEPGGLVVSHGVIVAGVGSDLQFIDGRTGVVRAAVTLGPPNIYPRVIADGDRVIVAYDRAVTAFTLAGEQLWTTPAVLDGGPALARAGDDVLVSTAADTLIALDRATGARRWEIGLGMEPYRLMTARDVAVGIASNASAGFALAPGMPVESARIHGRVVDVRCGKVAGTTVMIGATPVVVDARGEFRATIVARGFVTVRVAGANQMARDSGLAGAVVRLDGHGDYPVPDLSPSLCNQF